MTSLGKLSLNLGSIFLFAAAFLALALYMDDQTASWFNGIPTSILWPIDMIFVALGLVAIMFFLRWGREPRPVDADVLRFSALVDSRDATPLTDSHDIPSQHEPIENELSATSQPRILEFESVAAEKAEEAHEEELKAELP